MNKGIKEASLKNLNTYRIDATAKYLINILTIEELIETLKELKEKNIPYFIIGAGSNVILDEYFPGAVIKLEGLKKIEVTGNIVRAEAGAMMGSLTKASVDAELSGLEWAINIPGTIGGSIMGNAGAYNEEIFDRLVSIKVLNKDLEVEDVSSSKFIHSYRHTDIRSYGYIILDATFKLEKGNKEEAEELIKNRCMRRKESQPLDMPSAGSVFRNPVGDYAGRLIEEAGLKGKRIGGAEVSFKHANFIVNTGDATSNDIKNLIKLVREEIKNKFNIDLELEQEILDWKK